QPAANGIGGSPPLLIGGTRVFGIGTVHAKLGDTCIQIYDVGPNGVPDSPPGSVDDELLGSGGTDANGSFVDAANQPGIPLSRGLTGKVFAVDVCENLIGAAIRPQAPVPLLSVSAMVALAALLMFVGMRRKYLAPTG